jgi:hypothetical protein
MIFLLNLMVMGAVNEKLIVLLVGLVLVILGRVVSILNLLVNTVASVLPAVSVMLFVGRVMV